MNKILITISLVISFSISGIPQYYYEPHRPQIHFTPDSMWMNDPNGMVYYKGEYHLFYQYYPDSNVWGPMHWGHAISRDLVHWEHLPVALYPDDHGYIFSGSAVVDHLNTSEFGSIENPPIVAIYTYHNAKEAEKGRLDYQTQGIAFSLDKGRTWKKYTGNPVLKNPGKKDFRDPKVFWLSDSKNWIMSLAVGDHIEFYSSTDLKNWLYESSFGVGIGSHGGVWECPDLFPLKVDGKEKWILLVSINPGGPYGGSATQYFTGDFDGNKFINENPDTSILWIDCGMDDYAGVTWSNIPENDGRTIFMGWMSNWSYGQVVPTEKWRSAMTVPRTLELDHTIEGLRLSSNPVRELKVLRESKNEFSKQLIGGEVSLSDLKLDGPAELFVDFVSHKKEQHKEPSQFGIILKNELGERTIIGYETSNKSFFTDRRQSGKTDFSDDFAGVYYAPYVDDNDTISMHLIIDISAVELFAEGGEIVMTNTFFPNQDYDQLIFFSKDGIIELTGGKYFQLKSIWSD